MTIIYILLFAIILAIPITLFINRREQKKRNDKIENLPNLNIDTENVTPEQKDIIQLQEIKKIYIQQIDLENKIDKIYKCVDEINFAIQIIAFIIVMSIIIKIVGVIFGINTINNML